MAEQRTAQQPQELPHLVRAAVSVLGRVPGAGTVGRVAGGALDRLEAVSPRGRRVVAYAGSGVIGAVAVVEWPITVTGAAVAWLTGAGAEDRTDRAGPGERDSPVGPGGRDSPVGPDGRDSPVGPDGRPTPRVLASTHGTPGGTPAGSTVTAAPRTAPDPSPSDRLPPHEPAAPPGKGGPGGSTAGRQPYADPRGGPATR
ncbi:hypothetical protein [Streptomyces sp. SID13726]|uniref:hypothetical protein n=1 Tax=Streptomyces sp. SID13726 TaxID=2706058 RepID=UPI0013BDF55C|nr:hypothetical protein [Streptomyces sp. SID13726]NEB04350.1 hypothetical protein [Streptomyces sp. SID13726]